MTASLFRTALILTGVGLAGTGWAADPIPFRITLETSPTHIKTKAVEAFVADLGPKTVGQLDIKVFHSAQLFKERDVGKGLRQGAVEMALPASVHLDGYEPNAGAVLLPAFYGLDRDATHRITDGPVGRELNRRLEAKLGVKVIGRYLDLGPVHTYTSTKKIAAHEDFAGLKIRVQGGAANIMRYKFFNANAVAIPWPDVPMALTQRTVDGISSSHESVRSAKLWEAGIRYVFEDNQWFGQYIPMVSLAVWDKLSPSLRATIEATWEAHVEESRALAAASDREARQAQIDNGITIVSPSQAELAKRRTALLTTQEALVKDLGIDAAFMALVVKEVAALK
ncbi:MAG: TRAP transporter substrate-binding protein DctP [Rhodospirillales bacterium]|nr:TRAP transporter substrate-binding protein DctP [Rhodospirillales bacterium]